MFSTLQAVHTPKARHDHHDEVTTMSTCENATKRINRSLHKNVMAIHRSKSVESRESTCLLFQGQDRHVATVKWKRTHDIFK